MEISKTLYELLQEEIQELNNLDIDQESSVSIVHELILQKTDNVAGYLDYLEDQRELVKARMDRLKSVNSAIDARIAKFEQCIKNCVELNRGPISGASRILTLHTNPPSVEIVDQDALDVNFLEIKQEIVVKKKEILTHFKETGEIPNGVNIIQKKRVKIKDK